MALERVAVVGAGLAGLAAALELKDAGARVELFERSRLLGGRATSFEIDGVEVDNGQHVFLACCTEFVAFARRVGMEDELRLQDRFDALIVARDGRTGRLRAGVLPAPLQLAESFTFYPHLTLAGKLRIARALAAVILSKPRSGASKDETFDQWLQRNGQGAEERRAFWDPFFIPALNAPFDRVAAADAIFVLQTGFLRDAGAARFGFSKVPLAHLAAAAAAQLDAVHLSTAVLGLEASPNGVALRQAQGDAQRFDAVVLAVAPRQAQRILGDPARYGVEHLGEYDPYPIVDVHLWHDGGSIGLDFAAALESPLQWIFEKSPGYLCCSISAADRYLTMPTQELEALAWSEVRAFLPALQAAKLVRSAVTRNPEATWLPRVGCGRTAQRTSHPAVAIAGSWTDTGWPDTMESAVRSGTQPRQRCLASVARRRVAPRASGGCLQAQITEGWWSGELETNVTMTAEHVLLFRFLGLPHRRVPRRRDRAHLRQSAQRRIVGALLRRPRRPQHHHRGVRRAEGARRRPRARRNAAGARGDPPRRRRRQRARLHQDLARALRHLSVVGRSVAAAGNRLLSAVDAVQSLRFRLLGARHGRAADDRRVEDDPFASSAST